MPFEMSDIFPSVQIGQGFEIPWSISRGSFPIGVDCQWRRCTVGISEEFLQKAACISQLSKYFDMFTFTLIAGKKKACKNRLAGTKIAAGTRRKYFIDLRPSSFFSKGDSICVIAR